MQIQVGDWSLVLGVEWLMPSNAKEVRAERKRHSGEDFVLVASASGRHLGFHPKVTGKAHAAALIVGIAKPNSVICQKLDADTSWVCFLQDGVPMSGSDRIMPSNRARDVANNWLADYPDVELVGDIEGAANSVKAVLDQIQADLRKPTVAARQRAVLQSAGWTWRRALMIAGVACTVLAVVTSYDIYSEVATRRAESDMSLEDLAREAMRSQAERERLDAERKSKAEAFAREVEAARASMTERADPRSMWRDVARVRRSLPVSLYGYRPQDIVCTTSACTVTWMGQGGTTRPIDKLRLPNVERTLTTDLVASSTFSLALQTGTLPASQAQSAEELMMLVHSDVARAGRSLVIEPMVPKSLTAPAGLNVPPEELGATAKWSVTLSGPTVLVQAADLVGTVARWPIRVTSIRYQNQGSTLAVEGELVFDAKGQRNGI